MAWLAFAVAFLYGGRLTGLYYTGKRVPLPAALGPDHTHIVDDDTGYDGQYYHLVAHDPLLQRGFRRFVDNGVLRWRRIGVPGLAALLALGNDSLVDPAYVAIQLAFVFLGAWWLSRYVQARGWHPAFGLTFLLIPAVAVSLDRMTVDLPLAALMIGLAYYADEQRAGTRRPVYAILCALPLVRETGIVLVAAWCALSALRREWRNALTGIACALPAVAWWTYVAGLTRTDRTHWLAHYPFSGLIEASLAGGGATGTAWLWMAAALERVALAGIWLALLVAFWLAWRRRFGLFELTAILFAAVSAAFGKLDIWDTAFATARTMAPLLIALGLLAMDRRKLVFALPLLLLLPRIALQYEAQLRAGLRGIL